MPETHHELNGRDRLRLRASEQLAIVAFWAFLAILTAAGRLVDPRLPDLDRSISSALITLSFIQYTMWALLTVPIVWLVAWTGRGGLGRGQRIAVFAVVGVVVAIAVDTILRGFFVRLIPPPPGRP